MAKSLEERVEDTYKKILDDLKVVRKGKTEVLNPEIRKALDTGESKSGGIGGNYPDIQCLLNNKAGRTIPVMFEAKGTKNKLEKLGKDGRISDSHQAKMGFAVNGAYHYGMVLVNQIPELKEVIIIGLNGSTLSEDGNILDLECKAYYISRNNALEPKHIKELDNDLELLSPRNTDKLYKILDDLCLTEEEKEAAKHRIETNLESSIQKIHQSLYDEEAIRTLLSTNEKLYLFCGLIMAGLSQPGMSPLSLDDFKGNNSEYDNDGKLVFRRIEGFLDYKNSSGAKKTMILNLLKPVFEKKDLWKPINGESHFKSLFRQVKQDVIPNLESPFHLDFAGRILNSLNDWVSIENDTANDVVLTPRYVTTLMAKLCRTDMNSMVWDSAMGSAGFLVSAMEIMVKDAQSKIKDTVKLEEKIKNIKENQLLGIEILGNVYLLAVLNMILMGDGSSNVLCADSHKYDADFPANVFLLNPPYSAPGKGFNFVLEALEKMNTGYAAVLIQENAGAGQGGIYTKKILENNTLLASIHMPDKLFSGKASVQTAIYVFQVNRPHQKDDLVKFIDFSNDGYSRQNRKKSSQDVNLRDTDDAAGRYAEVEAIILNKKRNTSYFTEDNGCLILDVITLEGNDWTFSQHKKIDLVPTEDDFKKTVSEYLAFKVSQLLKEEASI